MKGEAAVRPAEQIPFALPHRTAYGRDSLIVSDCNRDAVAFVEQWPDWPSPLAILSGPAGSGKSHLGHIWRERCRGIMLDASELQPDAASGDRAGVCLAVDAVSADRLPEQALFHVINAIRETSRSLLVVARQPAQRWRVNLPDLVSRLRLATPVSIAMPDDNLMRQVLVKLFADRQLVVDRMVIHYMLVRMPRSFEAARELVQRIDSLALSESRPITRQLAARALSALPGADEPAV